MPRRRLLRRSGTAIGFGLLGPPFWVCARITHLRRIAAVGDRAAFAERECLWAIAAHVAEVRARIAHERAGWVAVLDELKLARTEAHGAFIFFNAGRPQAQLASAMLSLGVDIGRANPPYTKWAHYSRAAGGEPQGAVGAGRVMSGQTD